MRPIWTGSLSFGLVNIPIRLYAAVAEEAHISFDMLHKKDLSPIRFVRICKADGQEIPYKDIVKGYEYEKGEYVIVSDEDFEKANVQKTKTIEIIDFVIETEIDTVYYEKPYYLEPEKSAIKAYALLRDALKKSKKVGVAKFVLRNREHLAIIKPDKNALMINQLRFHQELRKEEDFNLPSSISVSSKEMEMALKFIHQLTVKFNPKIYHDTYSEELKALIKRKIKGKKPQKKGKEPKPTKVHDIMSMLKASLKTHPPKSRKHRATA